MSHFIEAGGMRWNVVDAGEGPPLLFIHGFPLDHSMWNAQIQAFSATHRVIAPDLRGFGQSDVTPGTSTMEQFADDLAVILDQLQVTDPVTLCGLSMGGYVGWQFWKRHGDRLSKLIQCDTKSAADSPEAARTRAETARRVLEEGPGFLAETMTGKLFSEQSLAQPEEFVVQTQQVIRNAPAEGVAAALAGMAIRTDVTEWLPQIDMPVLLICGQHDAISPVSEMQGIASRLPQAKFVEIPKAGHMAPLELPDPVNAAIAEFLAS